MPRRAGARTRHSASLERSYLRGSTVSGRHRSLNDLIRPQQERRRDGQAKRFRGLRVDDEIELRRPLHWILRRLRALENLVRDISRTAEHCTNVGTVA